MAILLEIKIIVCFIIDGLIIGLIFDLFRILRKSIKTPNILTHVEDAIFCIISALIIIISIVCFNNGIFRLYLMISIHTLLHERSGGRRPVLFRKMGSI